MLRMCHLITAACLLVPAAASGQLTGTTLGAQVQFPIIGDVFADYGTRIVGPGIEFANLRGNDEHLDIFDTGFTWSSSSGYFSSFLFNGVRLYDPGVFAPAFARVYIVESSGAAVDDWRLTFDADNVYLNVAGLPGPPGGPLSVTVAVTTVPEPSTFALVAIGLAGVGFAARRRLGARRVS